MDQGLNYLKDAFGLEDADPDRCSPLMLAYVGDAVYELVIRTVLLGDGSTTAKKINKRAVGYVSAKSQAAAARIIAPHLTGKEADVLRRGRNANPSSTAKNATVAEYRMATGFETLIGYLYLSGQWQRLVDIIKTACSGINED